MVLRGPKGSELQTKKRQKTQIFGRINTDSISNLHSKSVACTRQDSKCTALPFPCC